MDYAHNCGRPKWHSFKPSLSWKGPILGLDIVSRNVPYKKQTTEPKLLIVVSFFSGEDTPSTHCISNYGKYAVPFLLGHVIYGKQMNTLFYWDVYALHTIILLSYFIVFKLILVILCRPHMQASFHRKFPRCYKWQFSRTTTFPGKFP